MSESQTYIERFRELRGGILKILDGLSAAGLNWKPTARETNSLFVLATHLIGSEQAWLHQVVGQRSFERDRDAEFRARGASTDELRQSFGAVARTSDEILSLLTPADMDAMRTGNYGLRTVRWCILHMIEHYSEHFGQMSLTRQIWEEHTKSANPKSKSVKRRATKRKARRQTVQVRRKGAR